MERVECLQKSFFSDMNDEVMMREIHRNVGNPGFAKKGGGLSSTMNFLVDPTKCSNNK